MAEKKTIELEIKSNLGDAEKSIGSLKSQLRQAQSEVASLSDKFGAASKEAVTAAKKAAELADRIGDAKALTDAFNPDAKFRALTSSLSGVAGGFAAVQGGLGLIGVESADLEKQLLKVQSAMAISQGLQSVGESIDSFKQLGAVIKNTSIAQKALSAATAVSTFVTGAATTGLKAFRIALIGTGIDAVVVGLGLLITNFDKVKTTIMKVIPGLSSVSKVIGGIVDSITDFVGATSDASRALDKLKSDADKTLSVNKKFMQEHSDQVDEYTKKKIEAKNAYAEAIKEDGADQVALANKLNRELASIEFSRGDEKRKIQEDANKKASDERKAQGLKNKEDAIAIAKEEEKEKQDLISRQGEKAREEYENAEKLIFDARKSNEDALKTENQIKVEKENADFEIKKLNLLNKGLSIEEIEKEHKRKLSELDTEYYASEADKSIKSTADAKIQSDERIRIAQAEAQQKKDIQEAQFGLADAAVGFLKQIAGKNKAIQKAAIIAENAIGIGKMIIANNAANIGALATPQAILTSGASAVPVIAMNNIKTALGVATTIASTAKALSSLGGGSAGGAPSIGGGGGGGVASAPPSFNVVGASATNQLAQTIGQKEQQPVKAYVVSNDVTTAQSLNRNIISSATLG